jgi:hypothetical protein
MTGNTAGDPARALQLAADLGAAGWAVATTRTTGLGRHRTAGYGPVFFHDVRAVRGDVRLTAMWTRPRDLDQPAGRWALDRAIVAVRHADHDPADFARPYPRDGRRDTYAGAAGAAALTRLARMPDAEIITEVRRTTR